MIARNIFTLSAFFFLGCLTSILNAQVSIPSYGEGITITANDGSTEMTLGFRVQALYTFEDPGNHSEIAQSMMIRRSRLKADGFFHDKKYGFKFEMGLSNRDIGNGREVTQTGSAPRLILDAAFKYKPKKQWEFWFGQTKLPGNRERVISSQKLQFVDRSLVNSEFNIDRDFGIWAFYKPKLGTMPVKLGVAITNGEGRNITADNYGGLSYTGRIEILPLGKFTNKGDYFSSDLEREQKPKLGIGVSYNFNQGASRQNGQLGHFVNDTNGIFEADLSNIMADLIFKYKGWSVLSEFAQRTSNADFAGSGPLSSYYDLGSGFNFQTGYLFKSDHEIALRYTKVMAEEKYTSIKDRQQFTLGLSKYIVGHSLKCQTDFSYTKTEGDEDPAIMYRFQVEFGI